MTFTDVMAKIADFLQIKMNIYGFQFSFWDFMLWSMIASLIVRVVRELLF